MTSDSARRIIGPATIESSRVFTTEGMLCDGACGGDPHGRNVALEETSLDCAVSAPCCQKG
jgi:hypothetical protein